jgi:hypothetical protein
MNREKFLKVTPIALLILVFYIRFFIGWGYILGTGESALPFYNIGSQLVKVSRAWYENLLGGTTSYSSASLTFYSIISLLDTVLISNFLVQLGVFLLLLLISFFSLHCLFGEIFDKKKEIPAYLFAILYWFNPLVMTVVWNRFLYNFMFFWAFLPLALVLVIRGIKTRKYSYAAILSLSSVLFSFQLSVPFCYIFTFSGLIMHLF